MQKLQRSASVRSSFSTKSSTQSSSKAIEADATDLYLLARRRGSELRAAARQTRSGSINFISTAPVSASNNEQSIHTDHLRSTTRSHDSRRDSDARAAAAQEQVLLQLRAAAVALLPPQASSSEPVPGVVLSGDMLQEQAVDPGVLDSLSADIRAAHWRIEQLQQRLAAPEGVFRTVVATAKQQLQQANAQLAKLLEHRRRLLEIAKENMHGSLASGSSSISAGLRSVQQQQRRASSITAVSALFDADNDYVQQQQQQQQEQLSTDAHVQHAEAAELPQHRTCSGRRTSLDALSELIVELSERTDVAPAADNMKAKRRSSSKAAVMAQQREQQLLDRSWQQAFKLVFPDNYSSSSTKTSSTGNSNSSSSKAAAAAAAKRWQQEEDIRLFIAASTPAQHREFIEFALDPAQSRDLSAVAKCLIAHYTTAGDVAINNSSSSGGGAEELVLLTADAAKLLHLLLQALRDLHADRVPAVLMLLWLLCYSAPANRALLLKEGGLGTALRRLRAASDSNRALQYSALALLVGTMWS
jgi:hypothetical protein